SRCCCSSTLSRRGASGGSVMSDRTAHTRWRSPVSEAAPIRILLIALTLVILALFLFVPLANVFAQALRTGIGPFLATFQNSDAQAAIWLTLLIAAIAVPCNLVFGIAAAWAIAKFRFP